MANQLFISLLGRVQTIPPNVQPDDKFKNTPPGGVPVLAEIIRNINSMAASDTARILPGILAVSQELTA